MAGQKGMTAGEGRVTRLRRRTSAFRASAEAYVIEAERLLERSRAEVTPAERVTWAYRAALRAAGAVIEASQGQGRRRRVSGSAWSRLRTVDPDLVTWVDRFEVYARFVSRVEMGLEQGLRGTDADRMYDEVCRFVDMVRQRVGYLPDVA